jgi:HD-GYP domain-containing protein (c-di-GMP phosphodiesterase class II)
MVSERTYQTPRTPEQAISELARGAGSQFDPRVVELLCEHLRDASKLSVPSCEAGDIDAGPTRPAEAPGGLLRRA